MENCADHGGSLRAYRQHFEDQVFAEPALRNAVLERDSTFRTRYFQVDDDFLFVRQPKMLPEFWLVFLDGTCFRHQPFHCNVQREIPDRTF